MNGESHSRQWERFRQDLQGAEQLEQVGGVSNVPDGHSQVVLDKVLMFGHEEH